MRAGSTLLLVDDDAPLRQSLRLALLDEGYRVIEGASGRDGLEALRGGIPELVLLDLVLPDADGAEVCGQMRLMSGVPIVMISARTADEDVARALAQGADDYVPKPFRASDLASRLDALLQPPRSGAHVGTVRGGGLEFDIESGSARLGDALATFTRTELRLVCELLAEPSHSLAEVDLLKRIWGYRSDITEKALRARIGSANTKVAALGEPALVERAGDGYRLRV